MAQTIKNWETQTGLKLKEWPRIGIRTALFEPLYSYPRSTLFSLVQAIGATGVSAWMAKRQNQPAKKILNLISVLQPLSFVPDFARRLENKTMLGIRAAAFMHLAAGVIIVATIVTGNRIQAG